MRHHLTRFIVEDNPRRGLVFDRVNRTLSRKLAMPRDLVESCSEYAFNTWESVEEKKISDIFVMEPKDKVKEVEKIVQYFQKNMEPYLKWKIGIYEAMKTAEAGFKEIFSM